jgi:cytochrome c oxidase subunit 3
MEEKRSPELQAKVMKNLLMIFIFTSVMIFAGFTSAYLVMQGDRFWVNIAMPSGFQLGTTVIFLSSAFLILAKVFVKKGNEVLTKLFLALAFVGGILFAVFQFSGFKDLFNGGSAVKGDIMTVEGRYGTYFSLLYEGKNITYDNDIFYLKGEPISDEIHAEIRTLGEELENGAHSKEKDFDLSSYGTKLMLIQDNSPVTYSNNKLFVDGAPIEKDKFLALERFGENMKSDRGDFIMDGKYGEDFWIYYNGEKLDYENRDFFIRGQKISPKLETDLFKQQNTASAFIYVFAGMHLLHWLGGIIVLCVLLFKGLKGSYTSGDHLGLTIGSRYWHFLGILWLYLYLFLIFIH